MTEKARNQKFVIKIISFCWQRLYKKEDGWMDVSWAQNTMNSYRWNERTVCLDLQLDILFE